MKPPLYICIGTPRRIRGKSQLTGVASLIAVVLMTVLTETALQAAPPPLQGQLVLRPLTSQEIADYGLTGVQSASGLSAIGVGSPAYLEVLVNNAVTNSDITSVVWTLSSRPGGSAAALAPSPLGPNVPSFKMADRFNSAGAPVYKVAARIMLRPDITGQYAVSVTIQTGTSGSTNLTQSITAGTF